MYINDLPLGIREPDLSNPNDIIALIGKCLSDKSLTNSVKLTAIEILVNSNSNEIRSCDEVKSWKGGDRYIKHPTNRYMVG